MQFCLSIKQPFADLIASGKKTIELRSWNTSFRGEFFIHASKIPNSEACRRLKVDLEYLVFGAVIGKATLTDVKIYITKKSFQEDRDKHLAKRRDFYQFGFMLKDAEIFKRPIPIPGDLRFFPFPPKSN